MKFKLSALVITAFVASFAAAPAAFACYPEDPCEPPPPPEEEATKGNNGLGNGDQTAPGGSGAHNKAENQAGAPGHASGKAQVPN